MAVVTARPRTCSGLAYSGVISGWPAAVGASVWPPSSGFSSFAIPKSRSLGVPSAATSTFCGLMSRWMIRFWWAYCTAVQIFLNSCSRAVVSSWRASQYSTMVCPSTYSMAK